MYRFCKECHRHLETGILSHLMICNNSNRDKHQCTVDLNAGVFQSTCGFKFSLSDSLVQSTLLSGNDAGVNCNDPVVHHSLSVTSATHMPEK